MPTTPHGLIYPDGSGSAEIWTHLQALAESTDAALNAVFTDLPESVASAGLLPGSGAFVGQSIRIDDVDEVATWNGEAWEGYWKSYAIAWTASTTNPTLGNGTLVGRCRVSGKSIEFEIELTFGTTTVAGAGGYRFSLPAAAALSSNAILGTASGFDSSTGVRALALARYNGAQVDLMRTTTEAFFGPGAPYTWGSGDKIMIRGSYKAA